MDVRIREEGLREILARLRVFDDVIRARVQGAGLFAAARVVAQNARDRAPEDTGALRRSIRAVRQSGFINGRKIRGMEALVVAGGDEAPYAPLVELGTVNTPAQPYLEPALRATSRRQLSAASRAMRRSFTQATRRLAAAKTPSAIRNVARGRVRR